MSSGAPNTKYVQIPHEVPRDPDQYRPTVHFGQRLRERVPVDKRDRVVRELITEGYVRGTTPPQAADADDDVRQFFAFEERIDGVDYRLVVGLRDVAFYDDGREHIAVTIMEVEDDA